MIVRKFYNYFEIAYSSTNDLGLLKVEIEIQCSVCFLLFFNYVAFISNNNIYFSGSGLWRVWESWLFNIFLIYLVNIVILGACLVKLLVYGDTVPKSQSPEAGLFFKHKRLADNYLKKVRQLTLDFLNYYKEDYKTNIN